MPIKNKIKLFKTPFAHPYQSVSPDAHIYLIHLNYKLQLNKTTNLYSDQELEEFYSYQILYSLHIL
jgi:hypothetical protein